MGNNIENTFYSLNKSLYENKYLGALAVGLDGIDGFDYKKFFELCNNYKNIIPIAGLNPVDHYFKKKIVECKQLGYRGIKIHPRFSKIELIKHKTLLIENIRFCGKNNILVFFCTYFKKNRNEYIIKDPLSFMLDIISSCGETKIILMHSGYNDFQNYFKYLLGFDNILFDFSYTFMDIDNLKFEKEFVSIFNDHYDRICIGSDWPEYDHKTLKKRLIPYIEDLADHKIECILNKNIQNIINC